MDPKSRNRINSSWFLKFYTFTQNNSGGNYHYDVKKGIAETVIIQAMDLAHAIDKAENLGLYFDGVNKGLDCSCCGDRWNEPQKATYTPQIYGTDIDFTNKNFRGGYVHYSDGRIKEFI